MTNNIKRQLLESSLKEVLVKLVKIFYKQIII